MAGACVCNKGPKRPRTHEPKSGKAATTATTIGALIITYTILAVPYYNYIDFWGPQSLFHFVKAPILLILPSPPPPPPTPPPLLLLLLQPRQLLLVLPIILDRP